MKNTTKRFDVLFQFRTQLASITGPSASPAAEATLKNLRDKQARKGKQVTPSCSLHLLVTSYVGKPGQDMRFKVRP